MYNLDHVLSFILFFLKWVSLKFIFYVLIIYNFFGLFSNIENEPIAQVTKVYRNLSLIESEIFLYL